MRPTLHARRTGDQMKQVEFLVALILPYTMATFGGSYPKFKISKTYDTVGPFTLGTP